MTPEQAKLGTLVRLNSGGPCMTIECEPDAACPDKAGCVWFGEESGSPSLMRRTFPVACLRPAGKL